MGLLDLKGQGVGPAKMKEVAAFLASPESAAVRRLVLSGNMITDHGKDLSGLKALCEVLSTLTHPISLDLAHCRLRVAEVNEVATMIHAGAAVNSLTLDMNGIFGELHPNPEYVKEADIDGVCVSTKLLPPTPEARVKVALRDIEYQTRPGNLKKPGFEMDHQNEGGFAAIKQTFIDLHGTEKLCKALFRKSLNEADTLPQPLHDDD